MSRKVNLEQALTPEDRAYLESRGRDDLIKANEFNFGTYDGTPAQVDGGNSGDVDPFTYDNGGDVIVGKNPGETTTTVIQAVANGLAPETPREPGRQADLPEMPAPAEDDESADEDDVDNYDDKDVWSYADLQEEAKGREGIATNQSREALIEALRADDAAE